MPGYIELQVTSNYSFLRGASHIEELLPQARDMGLPALAITDHNTLAGIVRAHARAEEVGIRPIVGCRLDLRDSSPVLCYPLDRPGYARLCRLLTLGKGRAALLHRSGWRQEFVLSGDRVRRREWMLARRCGSFG